MTQRKPRGIDFESWADRQIREAEERGEFARLRGVGRPLPDESAPADDLWWARRKAAEEGLAPLHPVLAVRKEAEDALKAAYAAPSEAAARRIVAAVNESIRAVLHDPRPGPPLGIRPFDPEAVAREWRARHD